MEFFRSTVPTGITECTLKACGISAYGLAHRLSEHKREVHAEGVRDQRGLITGKAR